MKKWIAICLTLVLLILPFGSVQAADLSAPVYGDVSGDGTVSAEDALLILQSVVGEITLNPVQRHCGRVTASTGEPDAADVLAVLEYQVEKRNGFLRTKEDVLITTPTYDLAYQQRAENSYEHVQVVDTYEQYAALCEAQLWTPTEEHPLYTAEYFETGSLLVIGVRRHRINSPITVEAVWAADRVLQVQLEDVESCLAGDAIPDLFFITEIAKIQSEYDSIQLNVFHLALGTRRDNPDCWDVYTFDVA